MAQPMTADDRLRLIPVRHQPEENPKPPQVIPFTFSFVLWVGCVTVSSYMVVLCNMCYWLDVVHPGDDEAGPPFSWPLWGKFDKRIRFYHVVRSFVLSMAVGVLCFVVRVKINNSSFRFPQIFREFVAYFTAELDIICSLILANYLGRHTPAKEDPLIAFGITGCFCLVSSCLALVLGPKHEGLFSVLSTVFTSSISYAVSKTAWHVAWVCGICQIISFLLFLPIVLIRKGWLQITFACVFIYLLIVLLPVLPSVTTKS